MPLIGISWSRTRRHLVDGRFAAGDSGVGVSLCGLSVVQKRKWYEIEPEPGQVPFDEVPMCKRCEAKAVKLRRVTMPTGSESLTVAQVAEVLTWLAEARAECLDGMPEGPGRDFIAAQVGAVDTVAGILAGTDDATGWLPEWKRDEWKARWGHDD